MSNAAALIARWRVRLGYVLAVLVLFFAWPSPQFVAIGALVGIFGLWLRAYAAGYLHKQEVLTVTGPYAYTRNPLYLGSAVLALGAGIATHSWISGAILLIYFAVVYSVVMRREEKELEKLYGSEFAAYAARVPAFWPRILEKNSSGERYSWALYRRNREYEAAIGSVLAVALLWVLMLWRR